MCDEELPSQWCARMQNEALERGYTDDAMAYFELKETWESRGQ